MPLLEKLRELYTTYDEKVRHSKVADNRFRLDFNTREALEQAIGVFERLQPVKENFPLNAVNYDRHVCGND